jgi:hypothetical protein
MLTSAWPGVPTPTHVSVAAIANPLLFVTDTITKPQPDADHGSEQDRSGYGARRLPALASHWAARYQGRPALPTGWTRSDGCPAFALVSLSNLLGIAASFPSWEGPRPRSRLIHQLRGRGPRKDHSVAVSHHDTTPLSGEDSVHHLHLRGRNRWEVSARNPGWFRENVEHG